MKPLKTMYRWELILILSLSDSGVYSLFSFSFIIYHRYQYYIVVYNGLYLSSSGSWWCLKFQINSIDTLCSWKLIVTFLLRYSTHHTTRFIPSSQLADWLLFIFTLSLCVNRESRWMSLKWIVVHCCISSTYIFFGLLTAFKNEPHQSDLLIKTKHYKGLGKVWLLPSTLNVKVKFNKAKVNSRTNRRKRAISQIVRCFSVAVLLPDRKPTVM